MLHSTRLPSLCVPTYIPFPLPHLEPLCYIVPPRYQIVLHCGTGFSVLNFHRLLFSISDPMYLYSYVLSLICQYFSISFFHPSRFSCIHLVLSSKRSFLEFELALVRARYKSWLQIFLSSIYISSNFYWFYIEFVKFMASSVTYSWLPFNNNNNNNAILTVYEFSIPRVYVSFFSIPWCSSSLC